jgi:hypothetical protein
MLLTVVIIMGYHCCQLHTKFYPISSFQLVPYDAVNRNKISIRQLLLFIFSSHSLHVSAPTGHPQERYTIRCFQGLFLLQRIRCTYTT